MVASPLRSAVFADNAVDDVVARSGGDFDLVKPIQVSLDCLLLDRQFFKCSSQIGDLPVQRARYFMLYFLAAETMVYNFDHTVEAKIQVAPGDR